MENVGQKRSWSWWKTAGCVFGLGGLVLAGLVLWTLFGPSSALPSVPRPNGRDDLLRASGMIEGGLPIGKSPRDATLDQLRVFVIPNKEALALMRTGLAKRCGVPLRPSLDSQMAAGVQELAALRELGWLAQSNASLARRDGRTDDAIRGALELVKLGSESSRGGLMIDHLLGWALTATGLGVLKDLRPDLDAGQCRAIIRALESIDAEREPADAVFARERAYVARSGAWPVRIQMVLPRSPVRNLRATSEQATELSSRHGEAQFRLLVADLALRAYRLEHDGANPATLAELVPHDLAAVPVDPFSGRPLHYVEQSAGKFRLYSVGADGKDDGGTPIAKPRSAGPGDVFLEAR